jgi:hypothetical protein
MEDLVKIDHELDVLGLLTHCPNGMKKKNSNKGHPEGLDA